MARVASFIFALFLSLCAFQAVDGAPHRIRQAQNLGDLQCATARLQIILSLIGIENAVQNINATDPATLCAIAGIQAGFKNATQGVDTIALALVSGQAPSPDARDQVGNGLISMQTALSMINGTDPALTLSVAEAQGNLTNALNAGNTDVANC